VVVSHNDKVLMAMASTEIIAPAYYKALMEELDRARHRPWMAS
jgi:hypothetical protein